MHPLPQSVIDERVYHLLIIMPIEPLPTHHLIHVCGACLSSANQLAGHACPIIQMKLDYIDYTAPSFQRRKSLVSSKTSAFV